MASSIMRILQQISLALLLSLIAGLARPDAAVTLEKKPRPEKTLHLLFSNAETTLDPAVATDIETLSLNENLFDPMLKYDYLARPVRLMPNTLRAMPEVSEDGKSYYCRLTPGIYFADDPSFQGKKRELTAYDYAYSIKRHYDPAVKSPWLALFKGTIAGDDVFVQAQQEGKRFDVDTAISGIQVIDRYTLRIQLVHQDPQFIYKLATPTSAAMAREVVERYGDQIGSHPVGTGPFMLSEWQRSFKMTLTASPNYRHPKFTTSANLTQDARARTIAKQLDGKTLPLIDQVEIKIVEEQQSRVLGFLNREFDYLEQVPPPLSGMLLEKMRLKPALAARGIQFSLFAPLQTYYVWMNMDDPVIGGYSDEKIALRRAIAMTYNSQEDIELMEKGLAMTAQSPLPPNVIGYDASYQNPIRFDIRLANDLLDHFHYQRGPDGYRHLPNGQALELVMHSLAATTGRLRDEIWRKNLQAIGIKIRFKNEKKSEILKAARLGKIQMTEANWVADFPDSSNFYQLLYGSNIGSSNYARFNLAAFNQLFEETLTMHEGVAKQEKLRQMAQLVHAYTPWILRIHPLSGDFWQPWLKNFYRHPVEFTAWRYVDLDSRH